MYRFIGLILLVVFQFTAVPVSAQTITIAASQSAEIATPPAQIQYNLPYPGILPDHPLYFLKVVRDRVVGFLINDQIKKAEFNLLQSDKKLFSARMLFDADKDELGFETLSKSNNYMHNAISSANRAQELGRDPSEIVQKIGVSIAKHEESINELIKADTEFKKQLEDEQKRLDEIERVYLQYFPKQT